jgi:23S rRNA pseudouridine955/2504/2580 synthase
MAVSKRLGGARPPAKRNARGAERSERPGRPERSGGSGGSTTSNTPPRNSKAAFQARQKQREERAARDAERAGRDGPSARPAARSPGQDRPAWPRFRSEPRDGVKTARPVDAAPVPRPVKAVPKSLPVQTLTVSADEDGMRLDRFIEVHAPGLPFSVQQRIVRKGEVRVDGGRVKPNARLASGQVVRLPPVRFDAVPKPRLDSADAKVVAELKAMTLYEDDDMMVLNKPMGLAVQGGIGMTKHIDGMLESLRTDDGQKPRLVHRIDKDTAGCLLIAKTRFAATELTKTFRTRSARKIYWALIAGLPKVRQGRISTYLTKDEEAEAAGEAKMRVAKHGEDGAAHAVTYYAVVEHTGKICSWVSLKPVTGRTHQLRAHMNHIGNPIIGDVKYFIRDNWEMPPGMQDRLHLLARRIIVPHPRTGKPVDVTAPLPPHMLQSWNLLSLDASNYDPIEDAPEE